VDPALKRWAIVGEENPYLYSHPRYQRHLSRRSLSRRRIRGQTVVAALPLFGQRQIFAMAFHRNALQLFAATPSIS
jgi:hypothetical protein